MTDITVSVYTAQRVILGDRFDARYEWLETIGGHTVFGSDGSRLWTKR